VEPVYGDVRVFDSLAVVRIILDHFAGTEPALGIQLVEDDFGQKGDAKAVGAGKVPDGFLREKLAKERGSCRGGPGEGSAG
jgi:hypothetical protein